MLVKKQEFLEQKIQQEIQTAKKHGTKNKRGEHGDGESMAGINSTIVVDLGGREQKSEYVGNGG